MFICILETVYFNLVEGRVVGVGGRVCMLGEYRLFYYRFLSFVIGESSDRRRGVSRGFGGRRFLL